MSWTRSVEREYNRCGTKPDLAFIVDGQWRRQLLRQQTFASDQPHPRLHHEIQLKLLDLLQWLLTPNGIPTFGPSERSMHAIPIRVSSLGWMWKVFGYFKCWASFTCNKLHGILRLVSRHELNGWYTTPPTRRGGLRPPTPARIRSTVIDKPIWHHCRGKCGTHRAFRFNNDTPE